MVCADRSNLRSSGEHEYALEEMTPMNDRHTNNDPETPKPRTLAVLVTQGLDNELSSVAFTIANGGLTAGLDVRVFLTSSAVDLVRRRAAGQAHVPPLEPLEKLISDFIERGGTLWACTPCVRSRGYEDSDLRDGVLVTGASVLHAVIKEGAATLSF